MFVLELIMNFFFFFSSDNTAFENEFFEMAQAFEENSEMLSIQNKLTDSQVNDNFYFNLLFFFKI